MVVEKVILLLKDSVDESDIVLCMAQNILHHLNGVVHQALVGIVVSVISAVEFLVVLLLCIEVFNDELDEAVLVIRNVHHVEVFTKEFLDLLHLHCGDCNTLADLCFADLGLSTEHINETRVVGLNGVAAILNGDLLLIDEECYNGCDIDFLPSVGDVSISCVDICHGCGQVLVALHFEIFLDNSRRTCVGCTVEAELLVVSEKYLCNFKVGFYMSSNEVQFAVNMVYEIFESLLDLGLGIATLDFKAFTVNIEYCGFDCLFEFVGSTHLVLGSFIKVYTDDVLNRLGKLCYISLLYELTNLHRIFESFEVESFGKNNDCFTTF